MSNYSTHYSWNNFFSLFIYLEFFLFVIFDRWFGERRPDFNSPENWSILAIKISLISATPRLTYIWTMKTSEIFSFNSLSFSVWLPCRTADQVVLGQCSHRAGPRDSENPQAQNLIAQLVKMFISGDFKRPERLNVSWTIPIIFLACHSYTKDINDLLWKVILLWYLVFIPVAQI